jgi:hypothetical protein
MERTPATFCQLLNNHLLATIPNAPALIKLETARRWMYHLGFHPARQGKHYYVDGHEREDVVQYRGQFLHRMVEYERRVGHWDGAMEDEDYVAPQLTPGERRLIVVTHDESIFYSNEAVSVIWEEDGHNHLRPKSRGRSQHVSGFCCPCHGFIEDDGPEDDPATTECCSFHIITPGKNDDGYWTNDDLVKQLDKVIPLFERWHPDCQLLFLFDNSGNHHKRAPDGLCAQTMNLKDGGKNAPRQRNTTWDGQPQLMTLPDGTPKGLRTVLMERGGWVPGMTVAEARAAVADYPDFRAQK